MSCETTVDVYWNVHRKLWSIRDRQLRKVIGHHETLLLKSPRFHVSEAGRQRVLREQRKNVHAWITGVMVDVAHVEHGKLIVYNPYRDTEFRFADGSRLTESIDLVQFTPQRKVYECSMGLNTKSH